jgi:tRNA threonylcarbamoyladenosine biosynthesis protein TsaB
VTVVLGIDTATADAVVGVTRDGEIVSELAEAPAPNGRPRHTRVLLPAIEHAVEAAGGWERIDRIAIGVGPGSFTGLRIGISTARALAQARKLPLAGVGTLAALARGIAEHADLDDRDALPVLDARRGQIFTAIYRPDGNEVWEPFVADPESLGDRVGRLPRSPLAAGDGSLRFRPELEAAGAMVASPEDPVHHIQARHVCAIGQLVAGAPPDRIEPVYLRPPDAKRWLERDRGPGR